MPARGVGVLAAFSFLFLVLFVSLFPEGLRCARCNHAITVMMPPMKRTANTEPTAKSTRLFSFFAGGKCPLETDGRTEAFTSPLDAGDFERSVIGVVPAVTEPATGVDNTDSLRTVISSLSTPGP